MIWFQRCLKWCQVAVSLVALALLSGSFWFGISHTSEDAHGLLDVFGAAVIPLVLVADAAVSALVFLCVVAIIHNASGRHVGTARAAATLFAGIGAFMKLGIGCVDTLHYLLTGTLIGAEVQFAVIGRGLLAHGSTIMLLLALYLMLRAGFRPGDTTLVRRRIEMLRDIRPIESFERDDEGGDGGGYAQGRD